jgi:hypothetical protein
VHKHDSPSGHFPSCRTWATHLDRTFGDRQRGPDACAVARDGRIFDYQPADRIPALADCGCLRRHRKAPFRLSAPRLTKSVLNRFGTRWQLVRTLGCLFTKAFICASVISSDYLLVLLSSRGHFRNSTAWPTKNPSACRAAMAYRPG